MAKKTDQQRITEMEMELTHLQRDYEALNEVLLAQQKTIDHLQRSIVRLESKVDATGEAEVRDAESERPPHY